MLLSLALPSWQQISQPYTWAIPIQSDTFSLFDNSIWYCNKYGGIISANDTINNVLIGTYLGQTGIDMYKFIWPLHHSSFPLIFLKLQFIDMFF